MSDCPVCMGIDGYNIHMCGKGSGGTTLNHSGTSAAELLNRIAGLEAENQRLRAGLSEALDWNWLDDDAPDDSHLRALLGGGE